MKEVLGREITAHTARGVLTVDVNVAHNEVKDIYLTGATNIVAKGEVTEEDLML
ncbi:MAG: hypothetical protein PUB87_01805 [Eubacteriaceae bacterium]|nr:hypothetical protein [Eubacteriaceae bacterium]